MIEILVLCKRFQGKASIDLVQRAEQRSDILHAANLAEQLCSALEALAVAGFQSYEVVREL